MDVYLRKDSQPVLGVPYEYALEVRDRIIEDRETTADEMGIGKIGAIGSRMRRSYEVKARLFFNPNMKRFWSLLRKKGPTKNYLKELDDMLAAEEKEFNGTLAARQRLRDNPVEYALWMLANAIVVLSFPEHQYLGQDSKTQKRDVNRVINSLRSTAQVLRSIPYYDVPVLAHIKKEFLRNYFYLRMEGNEESLLAVFNPGLDRQIKQIREAAPQRPQGASAIEELIACEKRRYDYIVSRIACLEGYPEDEDVVKLFDSASDDFVENIHKAAQRSYDRHNIDDSLVPESLSQFLVKLSNDLESHSNSLRPDPTKPRPNAPNADVIAFCRRLDLTLRHGFNLSSPSQVANCANVVLSTDVEASDVKRWRIESWGYLSGKIDPENYL